MNHLIAGLLMCGVAGLLIFDPGGSDGETFGWVLFTIGAALTQIGTIGMGVLVALRVNAWEEGAETG